MLNLNLLPPEQKRNLGYALWQRVASFFGIWLAVAGAVFGVLISPAYFFIIFQQGEAERTLGVEEQAYKASQIEDIEKSIYRVNEYSAIVLGREEGRREVSPMIADFLSRSPNGVSTSLITYKALSYQAGFNGKANTRGALLELAEALGKSPFIKNVSVPTQYLIKEQDITFSLSIDLKKGP